ncbi:MAG: allantoinase AllB [Myxococcota bacterium]|nr:allantoinase AllB [Myxococcota bacterium]
MARRWGESPLNAFALRSSRVIVDGSERKAAVVIDEGRIAAIVEGPVQVPVEDLGDLVLMSGLVDCHVHINEPGRTEWEGFETATRAAAAGGITSVIDMPLNCTPVTTTADALQQKLIACAPRIWVDVGFWGGVVPGSEAHLEELASAGIRGAKCFLIHSGIDDFPEVSRDDLRACMPILRDANLPLLVHAELDLGQDPADAYGDAQDYSRFLRSRPRSWEDSAIAMMIELCRETRCAVHIVHLSSASALPMIAAARAEGLPLTAETCPHYLCLSAEEVSYGDTSFKCCPPIREAANQEGLWRGLEEGVIDFIVSDHSPCTPHLKLPERGDFMEAWGGIASLQLGLSSIWTKARERGWQPADLQRLMSAAPARLAGLDHKKGALRVGHDADLVAWDPNARRCLQASDLHHKHKISPYIGKQLDGVVLATWLRGERVFNEESFGTSPTGQALMKETS